MARGQGRHYTHSDRQSTGFPYGTQQFVDVAQMHFPVDDVVKNIRAFVSSVKRATGNREGEAQKAKDATKPGRLSAFQ